MTYLEILGVLFILSLVFGSGFKVGRRKGRLEAPKGYDGQNQFCNRSDHLERELNKSVEPRRIQAGLE